MANDKRPSGSGNTLRDYKIDQLQEIVKGHDARIRVVEDAILRANESDFWAKLLKYGSFALAGIGTLIGTIYAIIK